MPAEQTFQESQNPFTSTTCDIKGLPFDPVACHLQTGQAFQSFQAFPGDPMNQPSRLPRRTALATLLAAALPLA
ncbi:hypothetical protein, partial [Delftia tsuruhatensis]|uniref:hypothetical protein n=1 Tax=Delftia tsuruhatensis TaxID=180282 RepID=UPI001969C65F